MNISLISAVFLSTCYNVGIQEFIWLSYSEDNNGCQIVPGKSARRVVYVL